MHQVIKFSPSSIESDQTRGLQYNGIAMVIMVIVGNATLHLSVVFTRKSGRHSGRQGDCWNEDTTKLTEIS